MEQTKICVLSHRVPISDTWFKEPGNSNIYSIEILYSSLTMTALTLVEHFTFLSEKIDKKCRSIYSHFSLKKEVKNLKHFHHFFDLKSKWKMWNKFCDIVKMFLLHFLTEVKVKMMVKKSKVFSLIFSAEIKVENVKQSWSYC